MSDFKVPNLYEKTGPTFKLGEPYSESKNPFFLELAKTLPPPKEFKKLSKEEIIAMQPKSAQRLMLMTDEEHAAFHNSEISTVGQTTLADIGLSDEEIGKKIGEREISIEEYQNYKELQHSQRNTQYQFESGHGNLLATSTSSATPETRKRAEEHYLHSPPVPQELVQPERIEGLKRIASNTPLVPDSFDEKKKAGWLGINLTKWLKDRGFKAT